MKLTIITIVVEGQDPDNVRQAVQYVANNENFTRPLKGDHKTKNGIMSAYGSREED